MRAAPALVGRVIVRPARFLGQRPRAGDSEAVAPNPEPSSARFPRPLLRQISAGQAIILVSRCRARAKFTRPRRQCHIAAASRSGPSEHDCALRKSLSSCLTSVAVCRRGIPPPRSPARSPAKVPEKPCSTAGTLSSPLTDGVLVVHQRRPGHGFYTDRRGRAGRGAFSKDHGSARRG